MTSNFKSRDVNPAKITKGEHPTTSLMNALLSLSNLGFNVTFLESLAEQRRAQWDAFLTLRNSLARFSPPIMVEDKDWLEVQDNPVLLESIRKCFIAPWLSCCDVIEKTTLCGGCRPLDEIKSPDGREETVEILHTVKSLRHRLTSIDDVELKHTNSVLDNAIAEFKVAQAWALKTFGRLSAAIRVQGTKRAFKPNGWTLKDLCQEAECGKTWFRKLCDDAKVKRAKRGEHDFRFGIAAVRKLATYAKLHRKEKGSQASSRWHVLINAQSGV